MNRGTTILVVTALLAAGGAYSMRPQELPPVSFEDTGEPFFPGFEDPTLATSLSVVKWDEEAAKVVRFSVEHKEGRWVIPSHHDYPADGTERMGKAAASFIGVRRDVYYGDNPDDHAAFGVLDPEGNDGKGDERGKRITIKDAAGTVLVDVIVGKSIPDKQGMFYIREPASKRVYGSKLELNVSTNFTDWIEKDLLRVQRDEIVKVHYDPYQVDEAAGKVIGSNPVLATVQTGEDGRETWVPAEGMTIPKGKQLDDMKIRQIATAIANIKIVGVRPRPERLTLPALQSKGFFVTPDGRQLFGNEGQASIVTKDGIVYTLYFGEITLDSGLALTAGKDGEDTPETEGEGEDKDETTSTNANRYMFVDVHYDPSLDTTLGDGVSLPEDDAEEGSEEKDSAAEEDKADEGPKGPERAEMLRKRFDAWFYVISDMSFKQIHKDRDELFKDKPADD